jgi:preprotein translocase subunit SecE
MAPAVKFVRETYDELKQVVWPSRKEVIRLTLIVIFLSVLMGLYIGGLDWVFAKAMELILR